MKGGPKLGPVPRPKLLGGDGGTADDCRGDRNESPGAPSRAVSDDIRIVTCQHRVCCVMPSRLLPGATPLRPSCRPCGCLLCVVDRRASSAIAHGPKSVVAIALECVFYCFAASDCPCQPTFSIAKVLPHQQ